MEIGYKVRKIALRVLHFCAPVGTGFACGPCCLCPEGVQPCSVKESEIPCFIIRRLQSVFSHQSDLNQSVS